MDFHKKPAHIEYTNVLNNVDKRKQRNENIALAIRLYKKMVADTGKETNV